MALFLICVLAALPFWLRLARQPRQGARCSSRARCCGRPSRCWPPPSARDAALVLFAWAAAAGIGYAVVDLMPWSMVGDVIDEDDLAHGERREGLYNGVFTFLRKLGGALGVFLVLWLLDLAGFVKSDGRRARPCARRSAG